ncbi:gamma-glutamyltranspeptidase-like protein [Bisporella sp. PMI_857]|nr:gamma-glutamyltranspeptidase-like protein [Bisporella sp. PMI_857]
MALIATFVFLSLIQSRSSALVSPYDYPAKHKQKDHRAAIASLNSVCSQIGINIIRQGGNAADAIIAGQFCLGVVAPHVTGLGGGGFALVRSANGTYEAIDFREAAPSAAFEDMFKNNGEASLTGGLASGIPGEVRGLEYLHQNYGTLPWQELIRPSIKLSRKGFKVATGLSRNLSRYNRNGAFVNDPNWALDFAPNGTLVGFGDTITRKRYANLLETVAENGPNAFYTGPVAGSIIQALRRANGSMTIQDLEKYSVVIRSSPQTNYRDFKLTSCGAPSSGTVALQVFKVIEGYTGFGDPTSLNISTHRLNEAIRFGYGARTKLGDPLFVDGLQEYQDNMLDDRTVAKIRQKISDAHTLPVAAYDPEGLESIETPGTSHIVAADASGLAISLTSTVNLGFGSRLMVPETGLIMNNEMNDFSIPGSSDAFGYIASPSNYVQSGKRPQSSITPIIVEFLSNSSLYFVVGAAGGSQIITSTIQSLWHVIDQKTTALEALAAPRFHDQLIPNQISFDYLYNNDTTTFMQSRGHNITWFAEGSDVQAIRRLPNGTFEAVAEPHIIGSGGFAL